MTGNFPVGGPVSPGFGPSYPPVPTPKPSRAGVWLGSIACVLAATALVVGVIALVTAQQEPAPQLMPGKPRLVSQELMDPAADEALCEAIGPLMREQADRSKDLSNTGTPDSSERSAAIPKFKADSLAWADKLQPLINSHSEPPRYLTRTLQDYLDGVLLYSENLYADRGPDSYDDDAYISAGVFYGGPLAACYKLGVRW